MKAYQHELAHLYEHRKKVLEFGSASLFQSLITAGVVGLVVAFVGVTLDEVRRQGNASWYVNATTAAVVEMAIVTALVTIVLEQRRKRAIRRTLELAFLNHHIRNAVTQMSMAEHIADPQQHERFMREAVGRISEALFRIANSADLTGLSLEVDLQGIQLTHEGAAREREDKKNGTVFKVDKTGKETLLYTFTGESEGASPYAGLLQDAQGNLYGTTTGSGTGGTVFKLTP